jgi:hypothetical protein
MRIDWSRGMLEFKLKEKNVTLQVEDVVEVKLCEGSINIEKEKKGQ